MTISLAYQVAQKFHAATDPDSPPEFVNDRVRDIVDLTLIREAFFPAGSDLSELRAAAEDVFTARALEADQLGLAPRAWPPVIEANDVWRDTWHIPAGQVGLDIAVDDAIAATNEWIAAIARA